jgi:polyisoprenoid-binding protein YceI
MTGVLARPVHAGRWEVVNSLSSAGFAVRNFGVKTVRGQLPIQHAWVDINADGRPSGVHAVLDLAGIDTGNARRDTDLRKPNLLGTVQYPTLTFRAGAAEPHDEGWTLPGRIEARGRVLAVALDIRASNANHGGHIAVRARTSIDRRDLGVRAPRFLIGRWIVVTIDVVLRGPEH